MIVPWHQGRQPQWWATPRLKRAILLRLLAMMTLLACLAPVQFGLPVVGAATTTRYVATTGVDTSNDCLTQASPCKTIAHGISQAGAGDTINVAAGTYTENLCIDKDMTLSGAGAGSTIIDGNSKDRVVYLKAGTVTITGVTIQHGSVGAAPSSCPNGPNGPNGGGIYNDTAGALTVQDSIITDNTASGGGSAVAAYGGGIYNAGPSLIVDHSTISNNTATGGSQEIGPPPTAATMRTMATVVGFTTTAAPSWWTAAPSSPTPPGMAPALATSSMIPIPTAVGSTTGVAPPR